MKHPTALMGAVVLLGLGRGTASAKLNRRRDEGRVRHDGDGTSTITRPGPSDSRGRARAGVPAGKGGRGDGRGRLRGSRPAPPGGGAAAGRRDLMRAVSPSYLASHPWYPAHSTLSCSDDGSMPEWMTWTGGYAENHLFGTGEECCRRWFADDGGRCMGRVRGGDDGGDGMGAYIAENLPAGTLSETTDNPHRVENGEAEGMVASVLDGGWGGEGDQSNLSALGVTYHDGVMGDYSHSDVLDYADPYDVPPPRDEVQSPSHFREETYPTSSCGTTWSHAATCGRLCLDGRGCPAGQACHVGVPCPSSLVASAMGGAGQAITDLIDATGEFAASSVETKVCGTDYRDAESKCRAGDPAVLGGLGFADDFEGCPDDRCPGGMVCYGGIPCPLPPTVSPAPTRSPIRDYEAGGGGRDVVAYYDSREWYRRDRLGQPGNLRWDMITRVNYFFFRADGDGNVWGGDAWVSFLPLPGAFFLSDAKSNTLFSLRTDAENRNRPILRYSSGDRRTRPRGRRSALRRAARRGAGATAPRHPTGRAGTTTRPGRCSASPTGRAWTSTPRSGGRPDCPVRRRRGTAGRGWRGASRGWCLSTGSGGSTSRGST